MDYRFTHQQLEARETLRDLLGDSITIAQQVRHQPNLTANQREAVQEALVAMLKARREMAGIQGANPAEQEAWA